MSEKIRAGMLGTIHAHAGGKYLAFRDGPDYDFVGVAETNPEYLQWAKRQPYYTDVNWVDKSALLDDDTVQVIAIEGHVRDLMALGMEALHAGKHIHLDKPAGTDIKQFEALLRLAIEKGLQVQMGYMFRYNPGFALAMRAVTEGWLGEVFYVHGEINSALKPEMRARLDWHPGGMMFELACHLIDQLVATLGLPRNVMTSLKHDGPVDDKLADNCTAVFEYDGAVGIIHTSAMEQGAPQRRIWEVCGTKGTVIVQPLEPPSVRLYLDEPQGGYEAGWQEIEVPNIPRYVADVAHLAAVVRGQAEPLQMHEHDLITQQVVLWASGDRQAL